MFSTGPFSSSAFSAEYSAPPTVWVLGVQGQGNVGSVSITGDANVFPTGVIGTGQIGQVTTTLGATFVVSGVQALGLVSSPMVWADIVPTPSTVWTDILT